MNTAQQIEAGWNGAQVGMIAALDNANRSTDEWGVMAAECFATFAKEHGEMPFMTEDVRVWAEQGGLPPPPDRRAWGAIALAARRSGLVRSLGYAPQKSANAHRAPKTLWVLS